MSMQVSHARRPEMTVPDAAASAIGSALTGIDVAGALEAAAVTPEVEAAFAQWFVEQEQPIALADYRRDLAHWLKGANAPAALASVGGTPCGGFWLDPATAWHLSGLISSTGYRVVAGSVMRWPGIDRVIVDELG